MFKSIKTGVLALILISAAVIAKAQKKISQGTITYSMQYVLTPEQKAVVDESTLPAESKVDFNENISKTDLDLGPALITILKDGSTNTGLVLIKIPMAQKQYAAKLSKEDIDKQLNMSKYLDFKATGEKQTISGYNTEKYTYKDEKGDTYELWATNDVALSSGANPSEFKDVKGTPVKYTVNQNGVKTTLTIISITTQKVGPFSLDVPSGYELKTMAELEAMRTGS